MHATDAEWRAYSAHYPSDPELVAELATWTEEQLVAAVRGVPLATVHAMKQPVT
jgi:hypothetical protein